MRQCDRLKAATRVFFKIVNLVMDMLADDAEGGFENTRLPNRSIGALGAKGL